MHELLAPSINLAILIGVLVYYTRTPIKNMILNRHNSLKTMVDEARALKQSAETQFQDFNKKLDLFESETQQVLERARKEGEAIKLKIIQDAQVAASRILKDAEATALANVEEFKNRIRYQVIAQAMGTAEKIVQENLSKEDQKRIVNEYVGKVQ